MGCNIHQLSQVVNNLLAAKHCQEPAPISPVQSSEFKVRRMTVPDVCLKNTVKNINAFRIPVVKDAADNCLSDNRRSRGGVSRYQPGARRRKGSMGVRRSVNGFRPSVPGRIGESLLQVL